MLEYIKALNPPQREAVEQTRGPLLILAGAGSGKTRVLTYRMAHLVLQGEASPQEILAVTFTNKAAREMEGRISQLLKEYEVPIFEPLWISTFHSICARILRSHIHLLDYRPGFAIYDAADQLSALKKVLSQLNINEKIHPVKGFASKINHSKTLGYGPEAAIKHLGVLFDEKSLQVYQTYEEELKRANSLDFGDLLLKTYELFQMYPALLEEYQDRFKFLMVDEYQDTNRIQYLLVKTLAHKHRNLCVVGDEDQSIYSWRGADIKNILSFEADFPEARTIKLEQNYRSTRTIVEAANALIKNNSQRKNKVLFTDNEGGDRIIVREEPNEYEEGRFVVQTISRLLQDGSTAANEIAVFYRTNAQSRVIEDLLRSNGIAYQIFGGLKFYERMEIKDVIAYLRLVLNSSDDVSLRRIINTPARGIGKATLEEVESIAFERKISLFEAINPVVEERRVHAGATKKLRAFQTLMQELISASKGISLEELYHLILDKTAYVEMLRGENTPEAQSRIQNLEELDNAIKQFSQERGDEATLQSFLEEMALVSDVDAHNDTSQMVTLMTLHISKGLEFPYVFIVGLEEGLFPSLRGEEEEDELEEERRLAYVGMTRARQKLYLTHARSRKVWGQEQFNAPSRFLSELPEAHVTRQSSVATPHFLRRFQDTYALPNASFEDRSSRRKGSTNWMESQQVPDYESFSDEGTGHSYSKGMQIRHPTFGVGSIFQTEGSGDQLKVSVLFSDNTVRRFVAKFARLEIL